MKICSIEGCNKKHRSNSYCEMHYQRFYRYGSPFATKYNYHHDGKCQIEGCNEPYSSKNLCKKHYWEKWSGENYK